MGENKVKFMVTIDVEGIQNYLYHTGTLRDAVGGSYMVRRATVELVEDVLENCDFPKDVLWYAGGGNTHLLFDNRKSAHAFIVAYSARLTRDMPLLQTAIYCDALDMETNEVAGELARHAGELEKNKEQPQGIPRFLRLGFEEVCKYSGAPAIGIIHKGKNKEAISAACLARAKYADKANDELQKVFWRENKSIDWGDLEQICPDDFQFPKELDNLGGEKGKNYLAVIHADGNSMGQAFVTLQEHIKCTPESRRMLKRLSEAVRNIAEKSVSFILKCIAEEINASKEGQTVGHIRLAKEKSKYFLPLRPILIGGDDLTLVCDGRLGVCLATAYLNKFGKLSEAFLQRKENADIRSAINDRERFTCSAGVAIVRTHYPFRNAYVLAEALLKSAKRIGRPLECGDYDAIDFHVAGQNTRLEIDNIRETSYAFQDESGDYRLTFKPYFVGRKNNNSEHPAISTFYEYFDQTPDLLARNKLKELAASLHQGPEKTKKLIDYLVATYHAPGDSQKTKEDFENWVKSLSGDGKLKQSLFENVKGQGWSFLLDLLECDSILAEKSDFQSEKGLKQEIFWR